MRDLRLLDAAPHDRIALLLGFGVSPALVTRLVRSPRLQARLAPVVVSRLGALAVPDKWQAAALAMLPDELHDLANRTGAVWHAGAIARIIDGPSRRTLVGALGENTYELALAGIALAQPVGYPAPSPASLVEAVAADGAASLAAWCEAQPPSIAARLRLMRPDVSFDATHAKTGPGIVAWLLGR